MRAAVVHADRRSGTLAGDTDHARAATTAQRRPDGASRSRAPDTPAPSRCRRRRLRRGRPAAGPRRGTGCSRGDTSRSDALHQDLKLAVGDGILEFLPQVVLGIKDVDVRRQDAGTMLSLIQADSMDILLTSKDELGFLLSLRNVLPVGQDHAQQYSHHAERHQQDGHGVAVLTP